MKEKTTTTIINNKNQAVYMDVVTFSFVVVHYNQGYFDTLTA